MATAVGLVAQAQSVLVGLVGEVDARGAATSTGSASTTAWLKHLHKLHPVEAYQLVKTAAAFRAELPLTQAAGCGDITLAHAHGIVRADAALPADLPAVQAESLKAGWCATAATSTR